MGMCVIEDTNHTTTTEIKMRASSTGRFTFTVVALSDSYAGIDQKTEVSVNVLEAPDSSNMKVHPEDEKLDSQKSLFQQMMGLQPEDESDEEEVPEKPSAPAAEKDG